MKKYLYYAMAVMLMAVTACSKDDENGPNKGQDNTTDMAVTGGVNDVFLDNYGLFVAEISGYVNVTDEMKMAIGMTPVLGVELSTSSSFPEGGTAKYTTQRLEDNRKFTITATGLNEKTTYYYRTFLTEAIFGKTESFTTPSFESAISKIEINTGDVINVGENEAIVNLGNNAVVTGVAYTTDASLLTEANLKAVINGRADNGLKVSEDGRLTELTSGTTYNYCSYNIIKDYIILGEVKQFTTTGYNPQELAKQTTINATLDESAQMWNVTIQSSLESKYPGKTIRYLIKPFMKTSYTNYRYEDIQVEWIYEGTDNVFEVYATGNGGRYQASIENPFYNATFGIDEYGGEHYLEDCMDWWRNMDSNVFQTLEVLKELAGRIKAGVATNSEIREYGELGLEYLFKDFPQYADYVKNYLRIFVDIDGKQYMVKEQEGKLRVPTYKDNPFFNYKDITVE